MDLLVTSYLVITFEPMHRCCGSFHNTSSILFSVQAMGLNPTDPLLLLLKRSGAEVAGFGQLDETMQRRRERAKKVDGPEPRS